MKAYGTELLFVNLIFPIIQKIFIIETGLTSLNRNLHCGLNVVDELCKIDLPVDITKANQKDAISKLKRVNHLKELGRASFNNPLYMGENDVTYQKRFDDLNLGERNFYLKMAESIVNLEGCYEIFTCPCCGTKSLVTMDEKKSENIDGTIGPHLASCLLCTYKVGKRLGNPSDFCIMESAIFTIGKTSANIKS